MSIIETIALLGSFWLMIVLTMILTFVLVKDKTDIISFSDGLLSTGEFILITAGG